MIGRIPGARRLRAFLAPPPPVLAIVEPPAPPPPPPSPPEPSIVIEHVVIGATSTCNASCIHCPTNKPETEHLPQGVMPMGLFRSIIDQLASPDCKITGCIVFGLFGDALLDPHLVERCRYIKEKIPNVPLQLSTNAAAYSREKHGELRQYLAYMGVHIESLTPATYNELMAPLRLDRVMPKVEMILDDFGARTLVSMPVTRLNRAEQPDMRAYFRSRGAGLIISSAISNRCYSNPHFDRIALDPHPTRCPSHVVNSLIIDWPGDVFICCNDFKKEHPIGDFRRQSLVEVWASPERQAVRNMLDAGRWQEMPTCSKCQYDLGLPDDVLDAPVAAGASPALAHLKT